MRRNEFHRPALALSLLASGWLCGCQLPPASDLQVWAAEPDRLLFPDTPAPGSNDVFDASRPRIVLRGAVNESVAFQLVVRSRIAGDAVTGIAVSELKTNEASIPPKIATAYRQEWVRVDSYPAWYYQRTPNQRAIREYADPLIPLTGGSTAVPAVLRSDRNTLFWVDLRIPAGTLPGTYAGYLEVQVSAKAPWQIPIELTVLPFALPDARHVVALVPMSWATLVAHHMQRDGKPYRPQRLSSDDPLRQQAVKLLDITFRLLHEHRCDGVLTDLYPLRRPGRDDRTEFDWGDYDSLVEAYLQGSAFDDRVPVPVWPLPVDDRMPNPAGYGGVESPKYAQAVREMASAAVTHFRRRGWLDRHVCLLGMSASHCGDEYDWYQVVGRTFRTADEMLRLWCDLPPQPMAPFGWYRHPFVDLGNLVNTWCPPVRYADPTVFSRLRNAGCRIWWQPDHPPYSGSLALVSPPSHIRSIAWQAFRWASDAIWLNGAADWPTDPPESPAALLGNATATTAWLLYPGRPFGLEYPIPSIRLKRLQLGLQDAEYLWLLRQQDRPAIASLVAESLFAFGGTTAYGEHHADGRAHGWAGDPAMWRLGRDLLAAELGRAAAGQPPEAFEQFRQRLEWQRFLAGTRRTLAWVNGIRMREEAAGNERLVRVEATVCVLNQTTRQVVARAECTPLPAGWEALVEAPRFDVPPGQSATRTLSFRTAAADFGTLDSDGLARLPIVLSGEDQPRIEASGRLAAIDAHRFDRPVVVDGRLDEWPIGIDNVAADFVLVGAQDVPKPSLDKPDRPSQATRVFVGYDADHLYFAFNCLEQQPELRETAQTNYVRYEQMTPVGEDLVEIVFDPGGAAIGPGDLYHLVVKANGAVIAERGFGCRPPIGPHQPWPAEVRASVDARSLPDRWLAEIALKWSSFGPDIKRYAWWGINFARLESRLGEYSTWSGARWNVYTPTTLGNLHIRW